MLLLSRKCGISNTREEISSEFCKYYSNFTACSNYRRNLNMIKRIGKSGLSRDLIVSRRANELLSDIAISPNMAANLEFILRPLLTISQLMMIMRIVLAWYPEVKNDKLPWSLVYISTEPILSVTRKIVPPAFGVDISPIVWVAIFSFISEILLGPQGILNLIQKELI